MTEIMLRQRLYDAVAIGGAFACLLHCLATPAAILLVPTAATYLVLPERFHLWILLFALPTSAVALWIGYARHRRCQPAVVTSVGLAMLAGAIVLAPSEAIETAITVPGTLAMAIGHALNWRAMRA